MKTNKQSRTLTGAVLFGVLVVVVSTAAAVPVNAPARLKAVPVVVPRAPATSFHFVNMPVRAALQVIAEEGGFSLVVSDSVQGNVSLRLNNVTWQQALEVVMQLKGLDQRVHGTSRSVTAKGG